MDLINKILLLPKPPFLASVERQMRSFYHFLRYLWFKEKLKTNISFREKYAGQRCFLVCTGTSSKTFDFSLIGEEWVLGCNQFFRHPQAKKLKYAGYFELDPAGSYLRNSDPYWRDGQFHRDLAVFVNSVNCDVFLLNSIQEYCKKVGAFFNKPVYLQSSGRLEIAKNIHADLAGQFNMLDGVVYAMLGAAEFLGFREIFLIGCGYTYSPIQWGHFYEEEAGYIDGPVDPRHYKVKAYLEKKGVKVWNVVPPQLRSPVYDSISEEELRKLLAK